MKYQSVLLNLILPFSLTACFSTPDEVDQPAKYAERGVGEIVFAKPVSLNKDMKASDVKFNNNCIKAIEPEVFYFCEFASKSCFKSHDNWTLGDYYTHVCQEHELGDLASYLDYRALIDKLEYQQAHNYEAHQAIHRNALKQQKNAAERHENNFQNHLQQQRQRQQAQQQQRQQQRQIQRQQTQQRLQNLRNGNFSGK